jgi:hypothetical protein
MGGNGLNGQMGVVMDITTSFPSSHRPAASRRYTGVEGQRQRSEEQRAESREQRAESRGASPSPPAPGAGAPRPAVPVVGVGVGVTGHRPPNPQQPAASSGPGAKGQVLAPPPDHTQPRPAPPWTQRVPGGVKFPLLASLIAQLVTCGRLWPLNPMHIASCAPRPHTRMLPRCRDTR